MDFDSTTHPNLYYRLGIYGHVVCMHDNVYKWLGFIDLLI